MKLPCIVLLGAALLVGGCATTPAQRAAMVRMTVQAAVQSAALYVAIEHPDLAPEAQAIGAIATSDTVERDKALRAIYQGYVHRLAQDGLQDDERQEAAAIAAFTDAILTLVRQRPDLLPWLAEYLDSTIKPLS